MTWRSASARSYLQDRVPPFPTSEAMRIIEDESGRKAGPRAVATPLPNCLLDVSLYIRTHSPYPPPAPCALPLAPWFPASLVTLRVKPPRDVVCALTLNSKP